jgi:chemotaxis signal transduction protein
MPNSTVPARPGSETEPARSFCTFYLGKTLCGIDIRFLKDVNAVPSATPIPHAPREVRGYVNLRGQICLVIDVKSMLGMDSCDIGSDTRFVLFRPALGDPFGILVDRIGDIVNLPSGQCEEHRPTESALETRQQVVLREELIEGFGKLPNELLMILDATKLLTCIDGLTRMAGTN